MFKYSFEYSQDIPFKPLSGFKEDDGLSLSLSDSNYSIKKLQFPQCLAVVAR